MVKAFQLKTLFSSHDLTKMVQNFGLRRRPAPEIGDSIQDAFKDYILSALSELGDQGEDKKKIYIEARFHFEKAGKLLEGMPHPAGKMAFKLSAMATTLTKLIEGSSDIAADRATRFMEKNLVRRLRDIWLSATSTPFHMGGDGTGRNPRDFILTCFEAAGAQYPEITWFKEVDYAIADLLIKSIKR
ncbi:MAG: hypothetical protein AAF387_06150 [Pseudomonadota bacterium]